jgi:hypothetical protein
MDHYAECPARPAPMFGSSGSAITQNRVCRCDKKTFRTIECPTESAARCALQAFLLKINRSEAYIAQRSPTFGIVLDKLIADERLQETKAYRPGETVDEGLKFSFELDGDGRLLKVKFNDKNAAYDKLMRYHSLYRDKSELGVGGEFTLVVDL